jgi:hypothetical protein
LSREADSLCSMILIIGAMAAIATFFANEWRGWFD